MARIPQSVIDEIRNKVDIVDVIRRYVPLTNKGKSYKCICPFHDDHDPSLSISSEKQIYHCFVCGAGGNVFSFVQNYEKISFVEAVVKVGEIAGVDVPVNVQEIKQKEMDPEEAKLLNIMKETMDFCSYELDGVNAKNIKGYLYRRGLDDALIKKFNIGYNPDENRLYRFLHAKKYDDKTIIDANLGWLTSNGIKDVFNRRIMIPIHDTKGNVVGFTARKTIEEQQAKYINTSETKIYHKGNIIFNYHRAKEEAKKVGFVLLVEGAMDVLAYEKCGIKNVVATLGTACTKEQVKLLKQLGVRIVVSYDGDRAGKEATYKFYKLTQNENMIVEIANNKYDLDPDEIIETYGKEELIAISKSTISWIDFLFAHFQTKYDLNNYNDRKEFALEIANEITLLKDTFEKDSYYVRLQQLTQFDMRLEEQKKVATVERKQIRKPQIIKHPTKGSLQAQYQILSQMLLSRRAMEYYRSQLGFLLDENCNTLALYIVDYYRTRSKINMAEFYDYIKEKDIQDLLLSITNWELGSSKYDEDVLKEAVSKMKDSVIEQQIKMLKEQSNMVNDPIEKAKIASKIIALKRNERGD